MEERKIPRYAFIDAARGLALLAMVVVHAFDFWMDTQSESFGSFLWKGANFVGSLAAPLFLFLVGFNVFLSARKIRISADKPGTEIFMRNFFRGWAIFFSGYIFNYLMFCLPDTKGHPLSETFMIVQILHLIGLCLVLFSFVAPLGRYSVGLCLVLALFFGSFGPVFWEMKLPPSYFLTLLRGLPMEAYFPLFPWAFFPFMGYCGAWAFSRAHKGENLSGFMGMAFMAGSALIIGSLGVLVLEGRLVNLLAMAYDEKAFFHMELPLLAFWLGMAALSLAALYHIREVKQARGPVMRTLEDFGKAAFFLFFFHYLVFRFTEPLGLTRGWYQGTLSAPLVAALLPFLLVLCAFVCRGWLTLRVPLLKRLYRERPQGAP
ncbi:MAG: heparan-alpha-glucosaminide N-acetyltransferase domain-containing protein [Candidatus Eremiobacteraeota bacterium]|nr:heparan-alpha-glucosaminide N-acetyltransferase domain-containing protein [Candidatus Eremiobacteraeota bacterium]